METNFSKSTNDSQTNSSLYQIPYIPDPTPIWEWCFRATVYLFLTILYCIVVYIIKKYPEDFKSSYYKLVIGLAASDFIWTLYYLIVIYPYQALGFHYLPTTINLMLETVLFGWGWLSGLYINICIAVNRFWAIAFFAKFKQQFTIKVSSIMVAVSFVFGMVSFAPFVIACAVTSNFKMTFHVYLRIPFESCLNVGMIFFDYHTTLVAFICVLVLGVYVVAVACSLYRVKYFTGSKSSYIREIKLMFQGFFLLVMLAIIELCGYIPAFYPVSGVIYALYASINPVIYLALDSRLRNRLISLITVFGKNQVSTSNAVELITPNDRTRSTAGVK